ILTEEEARRAAELGVALEVSSRRGHCLGNGRVVALGRKHGNMLVIDSDAHEPGDLLSPEMHRRVGLGAGLSEEEYEEVRRKGETSGNVQRVLRMVRDCDQDAVLYEVDPAGPACHTGETSCFHDTPVALAETAGGRLTFLQDLYDLILQRRADMPEGSYTAKL